MMNWLFQTKIGKITFHVLVWMGLLLLPVLLRELFYQGEAVPTIFNRFSTLGDKIAVFCFQLVMIGYFYLNSYWLVPRLFIRRKFGVYFLLILLCLVVIILVTRMILAASLFPAAEFLQERKQVGIIMVFLLFTLAGIGHRMTLVWLQSEKKQRDLENEHLKTELSFLQGQINPHFLFNTLNTIYTLSYTKSERTSEAVMQLSNLLRYVLDTPPEKVPLTEEIQHLKDVIALHQLRLSAKTQVQLVINGAPESISIAPMLLLPLVENAFKHGVSSHQESSIRFDLTIQENELRFVSENNKFKSAGMESDRKGIGLPNLRRRLELLYPDSRLDITETSERYRAELVICL